MGWFEDQGIGFESPSGPYDAPIPDEYMVPQVQDPWGRSPGDPDYGRDLTAQPALAPAAAPSGGFNREAVRDLMMSSGGVYGDNLRNLLASRQDIASGVRIVPGQHGDVIELPNGEAYDVSGNAGSGNERGTWTPVPGRAGTGFEYMPGQQGGAPSPAPAPAPAPSFGGGSYSGGGFSGYGGFGGAPASSIPMPGSFEAGPDYTPEAVPTPERLALGQINAPGAFQAGTIAGPERFTPRRLSAPGRLAAQQLELPPELEAELMAEAGQFVAPTAEEAAADPAYQFRLREAQRALTADRGMQGVLRTGGVAEQLQRNAQEYASLEYDKTYGRRLGEYQDRRAAARERILANNAARAQAYGLSTAARQPLQLANQATAMEADRFNLGMQADIDRANAANELHAYGIYEPLAMQARFANEDNRFRAHEANASRDLAVQQANIGNRLAEYQAYQPLAAQIALANAGRRDAAFQNNFQNRLAAWSGNVNASLGLGNLNLGFTRAGNDFSLGQGQLALGNRQADLSHSLGMANVGLGYHRANQDFSLGSGQLGLGWANYGMNQQGQQFNQGYNLARLGLDAAHISGGFGAQYGTNAANNATGAANASAAGTVGAANAWGSGLAGAANAAMGAYYANKYGAPTSTPTNPYGFG